MSWEPKASFHALAAQYGNGSAHKKPLLSALAKGLRDRRTMVIRLGAIGAVLVVGGLINVSGFGKITVPLGVVALLAAGVVWLVGNRNSSTRR